VCVISGAIAVTSAIGALQNVFLVATLNGEGFLRFSNALTYALSGMLVPIPLLPPAVRGTIEALPFRDIMDAPLRVYMGSISAPSAIFVVLHQLIWTAILVLIGRAMLARALRKLVVQGG
jgi:ABC-2 type transport system permease protein